MSIKARKRLSWGLLGIAITIVAWQGTVVHIAQEAQEKAETRLELALSGSSNGLFDWTVPAEPTQWQNSYCWFSPYFNHLLGYHDDPSDRLPSRFGSFYGLIREEDQERMAEVIESAIRHQNSMEVSFQAKHKDGTFRWFAIKGKYSVNGHQRISGSMLDVTQQKVERQRADLIVLSSPDAVIVCDDTRNIILFNPAAERMFGYTSDEMIGRPIDKIVTDEYLAKHNALFSQAVEQLREQPADWTIRREDIQGEGVCKKGNVFPVLLSVRGIKYRDTMEFIATIRRPDMPGPMSSPLPDPAMIEQQILMRAMK